TGGNSGRYSFRRRKTRKRTESEVGYTIVFYSLRRPDMRFNVVLASGVLLGFVSLLPAEELTIGRPAPKLPPLIFVKGEAVKELAKGTTYVVEFWGTSCGSCIRCMPHLTELQQKHRDVVFLSVTSEPDTETR